MAFFNTGQSGSSQGGGLSLPFRNTYADLPPSGNTIDDLIYVRISIGAPFVNRRPAGIYRWSGSAWIQSGLTATVINSGVSGGGGGGTSFIPATESDFARDYAYFLIDNSGWQINRIQNDDGTKTTATVANNAGVTSATAAWAAHTTLTYA